MTPSPPGICLFLYLISNIIFEDLPLFGVSEGVRGNFRGNSPASENNSHHLYTQENPLKFEWDGDILFKCCTLNPFGKFHNAETKKGIMFLGYKNPC